MVCEFRELCVKRLLFACLVPIVVRRPLAAAQTRRPSPLVAAPGTSAAGCERIPDRSAGIEGGLGRALGHTAPSAGGRRLPATARAPDVVAAFVTKRWTVDDESSAVEIGFEQPQFHRHLRVFERLAGLNAQRTASRLDACQQAYRQHDGRCDHERPGHVRDSTLV